MGGHFKLRGKEHLRLSQQLIESDVATGYYFIAIFLQQGSAGLYQDSEMACVTIEKPLTKVMPMRSIMWATSSNRSILHRK
ncbi:hypothetical protein D3C75_1300650 [compost metagenome]